MTMKRVESQKKLNRFLEKRPGKGDLKKTEILGNADVADSLAGPAKTLERNIAKDKLNQFIKTKPEEDSSKGVNSVSNVLQGTAKTLEHKMTEDKVNGLLKNRPEKEDLQKNNVIKGGAADSLQGTAATLENKMKKNTIKKKLSQRPGRSALQKANILGDEFTANSLQGTAQSLETQMKQDSLKRQLSQRKGQGELISNNIIIDSDVARSLQGTQKTLEHQMKQDNLKKQLNERPTKEDLVKANIVEGNTADSLQGTANTLENKMKKNNLKRQLSRRPGKDQLQRDQILKGFNTELAPSLQANALVLEKNLKQDKIKLFFRNGDKVMEVAVDKKLAAFLESRPSKEALEKQQILEGAAAASLQPRAKLLEIQFKQNTLKKKLSMRSSRKSLEDKMILKEVDMSAVGVGKEKMTVFLPNGEVLGEVLVPNTLSSFFAARPSKEDLANRDILPKRNAADALQGTANDLEKKMTQDKIKRNLSRRPGKEDLEKNQILKGFSTDLAPSLQANALILEKNLKQDKIKLFFRSGDKVMEVAVDKKLAAFLESRPSKEALEKQQILEGAAAASLQPRAKILEIQFKQNTLKKKLSMRSSRKSLQDQMILREVDEEGLPGKGAKREKMAVYLPNGEMLGEVIIPESLSSFFAARPSKQDLANRDILPNRNAADSLQATANDLEKQIKTDTIKRNLSRRPDAGTLKNREILPDRNAAAALQGTANELEMQMRQDKIKRNLSRRPDTEELKKKAVMKNFENDLAPGLQGNAAALEANMSKDKVNKTMASRSTKKELANRDILPSRNAADALQGTANNLENKMKQDKIKRNLSRRPDANELKKNAVMKNFETDLAPGLQGNAVALEANMSKDRVNNAMGRRPDKAELADKAILPSRNAADALQGTANDLESKMKQDKIKRNLSRRPDTETLKKNTIMKTFETDLAPGLQGNAVELEANINKDMMNVAMRGERVGEVTNEQKGLEFI